MPNLHCRNFLAFYTITNSEVTGRLHLCSSTSINFGVDFNNFTSKVLIAEGNTVHCRNLLNFPCCHNSSSTSSGEIKVFKKSQKHIYHIDTKVNYCRLAVIFISWGDLFASEVSLGLLFSHLFKSDISRKDRMEKEFGQGRKQRNSQEEKRNIVLC